jgi:hypothetical protein
VFVGPRLIDYCMSLTALGNSAQVNQNNNEMTRKRWIQPALIATISAASARRGYIYPLQALLLRRPLQVQYASTLSVAPLESSCHRPAIQSPFTVATGVRVVNSFYRLLFNCHLRTHHRARFPQTPLQHFCFGVSEPWPLSHVSLKSTAVKLPRVFGLCSSVSFV